MEFLDRTEELTRLRRFLSLKEGALACLYGRRRIGKSRLLEELLKGCDYVISHVADKSEAALQRARLAKDISSVLPGFDDVQYADWGVLLDRWQRDAPAGSVLIMADDVKAMAPAFRVFLGQAWETLVREGVAVRPIPGVAERWRKVARWWGTGLDRLPMELDVVAESVDGTTLLVGEVKLSVKPSEIQRMKMELQSKVVRLPLCGNYKRIVTRIFAAQGGSGCDEVVSLDWLASQVDGSCGEARAEGGI